MIIVEVLRSALRDICDGLPVQGSEAECCEVEDPGVGLVEFVRGGPVSVIQAEGWQRREALVI